MQRESEQGPGRRCSCSDPLHPRRPRFVPFATSSAFMLFLSLSFYFHDRVSLCSLDITLAQVVRKHTACPCLLSTWIKGMCHYRLALLFFIWGLIHRLGHNTQDVIRDKLRGPCCRQCASGHILTVQGVVVLAQ